ncbi:MAG: M23 family metallopeptidase [Lachnospiraceae bacterium]|nr:M23 family metallopeptidase [Lachnospiraceae bacterium]
MQKRQRGFVLALCLCILSVSGIYGLHRYRNGQAAQEQEEQIAETEDASEEQETETANSEGTVAQADTEEKETEEAKIETEEDIYEIGEVTLARTGTDSVTAQAPAEGTPEEENTEETEEEESEETLAGESLLSFADNSALMWPVDGEIILEYSMDRSIYFSTLNQYKYHPAIVIDAEVGDEVWAAAQGIVSAIDVNEETGTTLTMTLGSGYEAVYGQLKELAVQEGDMVEAGSLIGYVSEPTKYYTREGSNLYFQLLKDGEPVDPTEYLN